MRRLVILTPEEADVVRSGLYAAKFALEQDVDGPEKEEAIKKVNEALDKLRTQTR